MQYRVILILTGTILLLAAYLFLLWKPQLEQQSDLLAPVWSREITELSSVIISLPRENREEAWHKGEDNYWYFSEPGSPKADINRWGGGTLLLLSGPVPNRVVVNDADPAQLKEYGFLDPKMILYIHSENAKRIRVELGDRTPDGLADYLRLANCTIVYAIDHSWYDVLERLVLDPPYSSAEATN